MAKIKVCLDAGHYGKYNQSPAIKTYYESEMNWKLHLLLKKYLEAYGIEVSTTRTNQAVDLGLKERGMAAKGCNLLLSIHSNAVDSNVHEDIDYPVVYVPINGSGTELGKKLAKCVQTLMGTKQAGKAESRKGSGDWDYYSVIYGATSVGVPGLIIEHSFHTNTKSTKWLLDDNNLDKMAKAEADIVAEHFGLTKQDTQTVLTYEVVVDLPTYASSSDAKAKTNVKGKYTPGTYYIYTKYPNGYNGMYNISNSKSGDAGAWINPSENVAPKKEEVQKLYRVRTSWANEQSQKGAFAELENAKKCCQESGAGYKVYDWEGKEVYAYVAPVVEETKEVAVYDLDYPDKHLIIDNVADGLNKEACTKAIKAIIKNYAKFDSNIAKAFFTLAPKYRIDPMRAISQSILETGWFKFIGSSVKPEQNNYCGLGATGGGVAGASFDTVENGVRAQLQHLYAYGCKADLPAGETTIVDPRFKYVSRGVAPYWEQLAGRWACPGFDGSDPEEAMRLGATYGQKIDKIYEGLMATSISDADVKSYFPEPKEEEVVEPTIPEVKEEPIPDPVEPETPVEPDVPEETEAPVEEDTTKSTIRSILELIEKIINVIIEFFHKRQK